MNYEKLVTMAIDSYQNHPMNSWQLRRAFEIEEKYYIYIASYPSMISKMIQDLQKRKINLSKSCFMDIGCGAPAIPNIMEILGCKKSVGLEYNEMYCKIFGLKGVVIKGDLLTYNFKDQDILYAYNPIKDDTLMQKGIWNIMNTMKSGAIFYFNSAGNHRRFLEEYKFKQLEQGPLYVYVKP